MIFRTFLQDEQYHLLAGDIGGTNTTLALMELKDGNFRLCQKAAYRSRDLISLEQAIDQSLPLFYPDQPQPKLAGACFTAAGPVQNNSCSLTNLAWNIDGQTLSSRYGFPVHVINDLAGICYGIPLLDPTDPGQLFPLPQPGGILPPPQSLYGVAQVRAVVAPGTGLGVGYLIQEGQTHFSLPTEAGHIDWGAWSTETRLFQEFVCRRFEHNPGAEQFVSGQGLENLFAWQIDTGNWPHNAPAREISLAEAGKQAELISRHATTDPLCRHIMELFVEMLARYASSVALWSLPKAGLYLAGGIPAKNQAFFLENDRFMSIFLQNYRPNIRQQLLQIPVFMVLDYSINLWGAAYGFHCLRKTD